MTSDAYGSRIPRVRKRRYRQAAVVYLVIGLTVLATTLLVPGMVPAARSEALPVAAMAALAAVIFLFAAVIWRGHRKLTLLLSLSGLYRAVVFALNAVGRHVEVGLEATAPPGADILAGIGHVLQAELTSSTPFFQMFVVSDRPPVSLPDSLRPLPLPDASVPLAAVSATNAILMVVVVSMLWRAARESSVQR